MQGLSRSQPFVSELQEMQAIVARRRTACLDPDESLSVPDEAAAIRLLVPPPAYCQDAELVRKGFQGSFMLLPTE